MEIEKIADQAAAVVRSVMQRELARIEQRWTGALDAVRAALVKEIDERTSRTPERGEPGKDGRDGVDGKDGVPGENGRDGIDGKDALEIVIQPDIDVAKSYPRGTFAGFAGGLVRSNRKTTPLGEASTLEDAGWSVIVRGIAGAEMEYPTERTIRAVFHYTDGTKTATEVRAPFVLDKGVFREGTAYEGGDGVTFGGSYWIAQKDAPEGKPGTSADWRLAVKKGRDGADARAVR